MKTFISLKRVNLVLIFLACLTTSIHASTSQKVSGIVSDNNGNALPYASVIIKSINRGTVTNGEGAYSMVLPAGTYEMEISYLGYVDQSTSITVEDKDLTVNIALAEESSELEAVKVYGNLTRGQAKALNAQKQSPNIKNIVDAEQFQEYPDVSAAEIVQRFPGISITRDQGEGEFVQIRGVPEQWNALTMNGQRMPSVEPDAGRTVGLDLVQSTLIQKITVTKALTPDMDADAIGGMVDFELKEAVKKNELQLTAGLGYNVQESDFESNGKAITSFSALAASRYFDNKLGVLVAGSYYNTNRGSMFNSRRYSNMAEDSLTRRRTTDYDVHRIRVGLVGNVDFRLNNNNKWVFTVNYNKYQDDEIRRQARYTFDDAEEQRRTRNRLEDQEIMFYMLKGKHTFNRAKLVYSGSYSIGKEDLPDRTEWRFTRDNPQLAELSREEQDNLSANTTFDNDELLSFSRVEYEPRYTTESNVTGGFDFDFPITSSDVSWIKIGAKYRQLGREYQDGEFRPRLNDDATIPGIEEGTFGYPGLTFTDPEFGELGFDLAPSDINYDSLAGYTASEKVTAAYLMNTSYWGNFVSVIGVRVENTTTNYEPILNDLKGAGNYTNILPSGHLTYNLNSKNQFRLAYSTGLSRPNYTSLIPYETVGDEQINRGNENLEPVNSNNFDFMYERYASNLGFISAGVFYKKIDNQIVTEQVGEENSLPVFMPVNSGSASLYGMEFSINQSLQELRIPVTINANYTYTKSKADYGDERDELPLANSPEHTANLSFLYDHAGSGLSFVLAGNYRHFVFNKFEDTDAAMDGNEEIWLDRTFHLDFSVNYKINQHIALRLQVNNITNQAHTEVTGKPSESDSDWTETEKYGAWGLFGVDIKF